MPSVKTANATATPGGVESDAAAIPAARAPEQGGDGQSRARAAPQEPVALDQLIAQLARQIDADLAGGARVAAADDRADDDTRAAFERADAGGETPAATASVKSENVAAAAFASEPFRTAPEPPGPEPLLASLDDEIHARSTVPRQPQSAEASATRSPATSSDRAAPRPAEDALEADLAQLRQAAGSTGFAVDGAPASAVGERLGRAGRALRGYMPASLLTLGVVLAVAIVAYSLFGLKSDRRAADGSSGAGLRDDATLVEDSTPADPETFAKGALAPSGPLRKGSSSADVKHAGQASEPPVGSGDGKRTGGAANLQARAARGDAAAQYELGTLFMKGRGVPRDTESAASWFEKAADRDFVPAQYLIAFFYEHAIGVVRNLARAREFYRAAAENGHTGAMHKYAYFLAVGRGGEEDPAAAAKWFWRAAEAGVRDSQFNLGMLYANGVGVEQSFTQAYLWFSLAAAQGYAPAAKMRETMATRLDGDALETAKSLVANFKPKNTQGGAGP